MIAAMVLAAATAAGPLFSAAELRRLPCGWAEFATDNDYADVGSRAVFSHGKLTVTLEGSHRQRTAFLIVDGVEQRMTANGPLVVTMALPGHGPHKIVFGSLLGNQIMWGSAVCPAS